jgi:hypothetical protein
MISPSHSGFNAFRLLESLAAKNNLEPPVDVEAIAKSTGVDINYEPMLCDGSLEKINRDKYLLRVNENSSRLRKRFTIAHELAHLIVETIDRSEISSVLEKSYQKKLALDWSNPEKLCDFISATILIPPNIAKRFSDWQTFTIKKSLKTSREWQVSLSTFLWSVFAVAPYEGGFIWYTVSDASSDLTDIQLNYSWSKFPKSRKVEIPKTVFLRLASDNNNLNYSIVDFTRNEERMHRVKFEFDGLSECRAARIKAFGKGKEKRILVVVYPREFKPRKTSLGNWQQTIA